MFENLRRDKEKYADQGGWLTHPGFWIVAVYRFGVWADSLPYRILRLPIWAMYRIARLPYRFFNIFLWAGRSGARVGPGLCLIHPANIMIGRGAEIGEDCLIFHEVTIGTGPVPGAPKIGNNVDIYVGARVLGGVTIGDGSMVGANCVVTRDVPPASVVLSVPCKVIPRSLAPYARSADQAGSARDESVQPSVTDHTL